VEDVKMKLVKMVVVIGCLLSVYMVIFAGTKTIKMGVFEWDPYVSVNEEGHGLLSEVIVAALERVGYSVSIEKLPFGRIMKSLENGGIDIAPGISRNDEREKYLNFTSPLYDLHMGFVTKKGRMNYNSIADLRNYKGGIMIGTFWAKELDAAGVKYEEVREQAQNIKKLAFDRIDFACMPKEIAFHLIKALGEDTGDYDFWLYKTEGQPAGISKKTSYLELRDDFEKGLDLIKNDGTYDKIVSKYQ
jgi:polar amino acid transport system substrate-binding protein